MASTGLNFANLTPDNGAVRDLRELIFLEVLGVEKLGKIFNFIPGAQHGKKVGQIGEFGMVGKASGGCNPTYNTSVLAAAEKTWDIKEWEVAEKICYTDLAGTLAKIAMKTKTNVADLTGTEYMDNVLYPRLELAIMKLVMRLAWFGDKAADNIASGGVLTAGIDKAFFTVTDGFWKRIYALVAADATRKTAIAANSEATFALQKSKLREAGVAIGILNNLIADAPMVLRQAEGQVIYITQTLKDAVDYDLLVNNKGSQLQWQALFAGVQTAKFNGVDLVVIPFWDEIIQSCEKGAASWNKPHRAVYTTVGTLLVGSEGTNEIADIQIWFNQDEQMNKILSKDTLGTLIAQDNMVQVAY